MLSSCCAHVEGEAATVHWSDTMRGTARISALSRIASIIGSESSSGPAAVHWKTQRASSKIRSIQSRHQSTSPASTPIPSRATTSKSASNPDIKSDQDLKGGKSRPAAPRPLIRPSASSDPLTSIIPTATLSGVGPSKNVRDKGKAPVRQDYNTSLFWLGEPEIEVGAVRSSHTMHPTENISPESQPEAVSFLREHGLDRLISKLRRTAHLIC